MALDILVKNALAFMSSHGLVETVATPATEEIDINFEPEPSPEDTERLAPVIWVEAK